MLHFVFLLILDLLDIEHINDIQYSFDCLCRMKSANFNRYIIEPVQEISNNEVCATSKASDQPAHTRSLIRAFASSLNIL